MPVTHRLARPASALVLAVVAAALTAPTLDAQYFGRNKVQYETFDFRVLQTTHFDVYYYPEEEQAAREAARMAERWYARFTRVLDHEFEERQPVILYANHPHFQQTVTSTGEIGEGTGGFTDVFKQRVVMPLAGTYKETDHVLGHELVHAFQFDISGLGRAGGGLEEAARRYNVPLWFSEGMAEYLSLGPVDPHTAMWLRDAALNGNIPTMVELSRNPNYFPYRWGHAFWAYVGGRWGDAVIGQILKQVGQGVPFPEAFQRILNRPLEEIGEDWAVSIRRAYLPLLTERVEAREAAEPLITQRGEGGRLNVGPSVSPDGRYVAFLSELDFLDVQLYIADAQTGEIVRRLVKGSAFNPHFGSLRYLNSAGTWSPDGTRFAFAALRGAHDVVAVVDVRNGRILREYSIPDVGEINNPTWSPDGRTIVFSGIRGGITDLYAVDVESGEGRQLTDDAFAELHPAYSPDGGTIAFVTDRGPETDLSRLEWGNYKVALYDVASGEIRVVPRMERGKNVNPQWSSDGTSVFFVSDREGISNVYRVDVRTGELAKVTNLFTGVSGITELSPSISTASRADRLIFTAYEQNFGFNVYALAGSEELAGTPEAASVVVADTAAPLPAVLPPVPRPAEREFNRVATLLRDPAYGLPDAQTVASWEVVPYRARLGLDYIGQPQIGVSTSSAFNRGGVYGGIGAIFSDVLGRHTVWGTIQAQGRLEEIGFNTVYLNQRQRWNWGVAASRIPYIADVRRFGTLSEDDEFLNQLRVTRVFDTSLSGLAQYPLSRVQRVEASVGVRRISLDTLIQEYIHPTFVDDAGNVNVGPPRDFRERDVDGPAYNFAQASLALVYDNSLMGYTSPFAGQRYHFEVAPTVGSGDFVTAIADYRKYFFLRPVTLAVRGLHFGRYGSDETLFGRQFLGNAYFMRGYGYGDVRDRCVDSGSVEGSAMSDECRVLESLFGTRLAVGNVELRVPLLSGLFGTSGLSPIEGIAFADAGVSWGQDAISFGQFVDTHPVFEVGLQDNPEERGFLTSAGAGARINLLGYVVVEAVFVNAFQRDRGWHWQFSFIPGF